MRRYPLTILDLTVGADGDAGVVLELLRLLDGLGLAGLSFALRGLRTLSLSSGLTSLSFASGFSTLGRIGVTIPIPLALALGLLRSLLCLRSFTGVGSKTLLSLRRLARVCSRTSLSLSLAGSLSLSAGVGGAILLALVGSVQESIEGTIASSAGWLVASELDTSDRQAAVPAASISRLVSRGGGTTLLSGSLALALAFSAELQASGAADVDSPALEADLPPGEVGFLDARPDEYRGAAGNATLRERDVLANIPIRRGQPLGEGVIASGRCLNGTR